MPLARILTFDPRHAAELARQLQDVGFQVEIANPNEQHSTPADLDIELAVCDQPQALGRAAAIAAQLQADVIVFPGAVPPLPKPIPEAAAAAAILADLSLTQSSEATEIRRQEPEVILEHPIEPIQPITEDYDFTPADPTEGPVGPSILAQWADTLRDSFKGLGLRLADGFTRAKSATASGSNALAAGARQFHQGLKERMKETRAAWEQRQAERRERAEVLRRERRQEAELAAAAREEVQRREEQEQREAALLAASAQPEPPARADFSRVGMKQEELRRIQAEKERLQVEVERLRAEAALQAAALEEARQARERFAEAAEAAPKAVPRRNKSSLHGALAGAVAATLLFLVGMVLANFRSVAPLSRDLNTGSIEQQSPFGSATVHGPPGVTVGGTPAAKPTQASAAPVVPGPTQVKPQPTSSPNAPVANKKSQRRHFQRQAENEDNATADDVVVRHFPNRNPPAQTAQRQKIKRYSDE